MFRIHIIKGEIHMKIVDIKKFIRSMIFIGALILFVSFIFVNKTLSHVETTYKKIYVSSGDTLWNIAQNQKSNNQYFEDKDIRSIIDEIKYTNQLTSSNLKVGQELNIPTI